MKKDPMDINRVYLLTIFTVCAVIPHMALWLLKLEPVSVSLAPIERETYANFFVCQWTPFWLAVLSYLRLQKQDRFSLLPGLGAAAVVLSYLPGYDHRSVAILALTVPLLLAAELSGFFRKGETSRSSFFRALAADREMLRAFFFWTVECLAVYFISCEACTWETTVASPFLLFPLPGILLFSVLHHQKSRPPAFQTVLLMLASVPLPLYLVTLGPMAQFRMYHLMCLALGYGFLFLMLFVYNIDWWKSRKNPS